MGREVIMKKAVHNIEPLPTRCIREVNDSVEFIFQKTEEVMIIEEFKQLLQLS